MNKFICVHGHFYQPSRENPWTNTVDQQESAAPYHDWNERINAECYAPNGKSILVPSDSAGMGTESNYARMSFNFGPTLLTWLEKNAPETYRSILEADRQSRQRFSGHGNAMAQCYHHMIMPLASERDKKTQLVWGIRDFEFRFQRKPEGIWFPETAVDTRTLEVAADHGVKFTVLAPNQADKVKRKDHARWHPVTSDTLFTQVPYICHLPSGQKMAIFFYDGRIAHEVAFGELLRNGEHFAHRLISEFDDHGREPRLVHIATDGETYGHHHTFGDKALAYCLRTIESNPSLRLTNYGEFLALVPPVLEVILKENSSWSCSHGVERWRSDCGCALETRNLWNQKWRKKLRESLDFLRDALVEVYEREMEPLCHYPWLMRDEYISVLLDDSESNVEHFLNKFSSQSLEPRQREKVFKLLEMQRYAMLMYTSCGWFFDDVSGLETRQVIQYAGRAIQLAEETSGVSVERDFLNMLESAKSNIPRFHSGKKIYEQYVKPSLAHT